jgi:glycosyltransferase involved in cell wall biosynthesis
MKKKILFLGETYRADAITWMKGLKEFGPFELYTWELAQAGTGVKKIKRAFETISRLRGLKKEIIRLQPDLIIAERVTSYGFIGTLFHKYAPVVIAQQGITDIYPPDSIAVPLKKIMQNYAFKHTTLIHAWGEIMTYSMLKYGTDLNKIMVLPKGIDMRDYLFTPQIKDEKIRAIVTRSLTQDYRHETILSAFEIIKQQHIPFELVIVGDGRLKEQLVQSAIDKNIQEEVIFAGSIPNTELPGYLANSDLYISMPSTEGVSASLLEAMAAGCYPVISDLPGNRAWITDGINGMLIPVDDVKKLACAIEWYFKNRQGLQQILNKNRQLVEQKASYENNMKVICDTYVNIIKNKMTCVV